MRQLTKRSYRILNNKERTRSFHRTRPGISTTAATAPASKRLCDEPVPIILFPSQREEEITRTKRARIRRHAGDECSAQRFFIAKLQVAGVSPVLPQAVSRVGPNEPLDFLPVIEW